MRSKRACSRRTSTRDFTIDASYPMTPHHCGGVSPTRTAMRRESMQTTIRALLGAGLIVTAFGVAVAKLPPAPPMTDEQKAEKATKDKATADAEAARLNKAMD